MLRVLVSIALASTLCACEQTDPAAARGAGGAVVGAPVEPSAPEQGSAQESDPSSTTRVRKEMIQWTDTKTAAESTRDAASGLPTGKRQHTPVRFVK